MLLHFLEVEDAVRSGHDQCREALLVSMVAELPFHELRFELKLFLRITWASAARCLDVVVSERCATRLRFDR